MSENKSAEEHPTPWRIEECPKGWGQFTVIFDSNNKCVLHDRPVNLNLFTKIVTSVNELTTLQQANAELQVDLQFFKNSQRLNEEQVQHQYNKIAELKQELSDKDTAYILTKNTLIRRTKKLKELEKQNAEMVNVLNRIYKWELPETGRFWDDEKTRPISYETEYGSNGARDYIKKLAFDAIKSNKQP